MKRTLLCIFVTLMLSACNNDEAEIKAVAYGYLDALNNYRFEEAMSYATPQTQEVTLRYFAAIRPLFTDELIHRNTPASVKIKEIEHINDSIVVAHYDLTTPTTKEQSKRTLVKQNDKWLVHDVIDFSSGNQ